MSGLRRHPKSSSTSSPPSLTAVHSRAPERDIIGLPGRQGGDHAGASATAGRRRGGHGGGADEDGALPSEFFEEAVGPGGCAEISKVDTVRELDVLARPEVEQGVTANLLQRDHEPTAREGAAEPRSAGVFGEGWNRIAETAEDPVAGGGGGGGHEQPRKRDRLLERDAAPMFADGGEPAAVGDARE